MKDEIISYREMCDRENAQTLQRGMNYRINNNYSLILMSQRKNAPYHDRIFEDGFTIQYEGHDVSKSADVNDPKKNDQPRFTNTGKPTQNGLFAEAVDQFKAGKREPEIVKAYEKLFSGIWSERGYFQLTDYRYVSDAGNRKVFQFILVECESFEQSPSDNSVPNPIRSRIIPSEIKREVWKRDGGKCVLCGAKDELHFDHDLPYSKGGTSYSIKNVRILCARHNLQKSDKIE